LAPTYELALQIGEVTKQMSKFMGDIHIVFAVRGAEGGLCQDTVTDFAYVVLLCSLSDNGNLTFLDLLLIL